MNGATGADGGVEHGARLVAFTEAVMGDDDVALERERKALRALLTPEAFVDCAATVGAFNVVDRIAENCEPAMTSVLFVAGAGGSLRAGVTENPVRLTRSVRDAVTRVSCGGAPVYIWPGGGITMMVDVTRMPAGSFGSVPTPALVAPIEFSLPLSDYEELGGHMDAVSTLETVLSEGAIAGHPWRSDNPWPVMPARGN